MPATKAKSKQKRTLRPTFEGMCGLVQSYRDLVETYREDRSTQFRVIANQHAMLDVMAKALESANVHFEMADAGWLRLIREKKEMQRIIQAYERAWVKGQDEPTINGRCCK